VVNFTICLIYPFQGRQLLIPTENEAGWPLRRLGYIGVEKYLLLLLGIKPQIVQIVA
jgi:hypothetical protein